MLKCKVLSNVFEHGTVYGKKGDSVVVPEHIGKAHSKGKNPNLQVLGEVDSAPAPKPAKAPKKATVAPAPATPAKA